ncbi:hypothetical protein QE152_g11014 [Popillia japonica]|uniref:Uncharacterized protein n=1 Tax=Popillia japonica TaxID=7064 RepID=A0AAW1LSZ1_POPJA
MHHGLTLLCAHQLAFQFAKAKHKKYPQKWDEVHCSDVDFLDCPVTDRPAELVCAVLEDEASATTSHMAENENLNSKVHESILQSENVVLQESLPLTELTSRKKKTVVLFKDDGLLSQKITKPTDHSSSSDKDEGKLSDSNSEDIESNEEELLQINALEDVKRIQAEDLVLVKFATKTSIVHYVGCVVTTQEDECAIKSWVCIQNL